ncbi:Uncharacterized protein conserved in bacteria [Bordetella pertussis]|nr:Uncharacterized protein conserved in bacteria [Bordetella pertussis]
MLPFAALPTLPRIAARALNALLERESWARDRLARHAGKTVRFALGGFPNPPVWLACCPATAAPISPI